MKNLNGSSVTFPQDNRLSFEENSHKYMVDSCYEMCPVSNVVAKFFKPFDAEFWSLRKSDGDARAAARLREEWESKGYLSSHVGTFLHKQIENVLNDVAMPCMSCDVEYNGKYVHLSKTVDISKEWKFFKAFDRDTAYQPFRTEWGVFDLDAKIAGTIDLICSRTDGTYEIYDWKRSNKVNPSEYNKWSKGLHGLGHLSDTSYSHYCLQQNLYRYIVEKNYGLKISRMNLVVLHPDYNNYRIVPVPMMDREVGIILKNI